MGFTFFILLLGALVFTLIQKHEIKSNKDYKAATIRKAFRSSMGHGRDNIYQFKLYCKAMRYLLERAQQDGIGVGEKRDVAFYDRHYHEIRKGYCHEQDPVQWCMHKATDYVMDHNYVNAWIFNEYGTGYYDEKDIAHGVHRMLRKNTGTWTACKSEYSRDLNPYSRIEGVMLPKDGVTGAEKILRQLYSLNHEYDSHAPSFEESGITLYN